TPGAARRSTPARGRSPGGTRAPTRTGASGRRRAGRGRPRRESAGAAARPRSASRGGAPPAAASRRPLRRRRTRPRRPGGRRAATGSCGSAPYDICVNSADRHLRLLTETTAAVNSPLALEEVLHLVADKVSDVLRADACFVYLYDERTNELVLRATHGASVDDLPRRPRMRPGEGITGSAAAERAPVMIASAAHLDPR